MDKLYFSFCGTLPYFVKWNDAEVVTKSEKWNNKINHAVSENTSKVSSLMKIMNCKFLIEIITDQHETLIISIWNIS